LAFIKRRSRRLEKSTRLFLNKPPTTTTTKKKKKTPKKKMKRG